MKCHICGAEMMPIETVESPISGETVVTEYQCSYSCDYIEWLGEK